MAYEEIRKKLDEQPFAKLNMLIYEYLANQIITMELKPGTKLNENLIAKELGVSRSPVNMAMQQLEADGLITKPSRGTPFVTKMEPDDCCMLCEIRNCLEGEAAYYAAKRISPSALKKLKTLLLQFKDLKTGTDATLEDVDKYVHLDAEFHKIIIEASGNKFFIDSYNGIYRNLMRWRWYINNTTLNSPTYNIHEYNHHFAIYRALENHHSSLARDEVLCDISRMFSILHYLH